MIDALYIATSGLQGQQSQIDAISNNLANMQTPGFKRSRVSFANVATATPSQVLQQDVQSSFAGAGTEVLATRPVFSEGALRQTGNTLDIAIRGAGFLEVVNAAGDHLYTRDGQLRLDQDGYLTTIDGSRLASNIQVPPDARDLVIDDTGKVSAKLGNDSEASQLGQIELSVFPSNDGLQAVSGNAYVPTQQSGDPSTGKPNDVGFGSILQGSLEQSNVDMVQEMTTLVLAQRAYQLNARILQAADEILDTINNLRR